MSKTRGDDQAFLREAIAQSAEKWWRRRDRPLKPRPRTK